LSAQLNDDLAFLEVANVGGEFLSPDKAARIKGIAQHSVVVGDWHRLWSSRTDFHRLSTLFHMKTMNAPFTHLFTLHIQIQ
jgi:hypothetical protein